MFARLSVGHLWAQHDVAEQTDRRLLAVGRWTQLIHREAQHVGGTRLPKILLVVGAHGGFVDEQDRKFGQRMDSELVEGERGESDEGCIVNLDTGLVADVDAHIRALNRDRIPRAIA
jgi:hypothetical protein